MRIIAGEWRGRSLHAPESHLVRPTSDRVRESLFSILSSRFDGDWSALQVADFCAGTGALGLEALSRGVRHCTFVEKDSAAIRLIEANIAACKAGARARILRGDVTRLPPASAAVDLILFDPPYGQDIMSEAIVSAEQGGWVKPETLLVLEQPRNASPTLTGWNDVDVRIYGKTQLMFWKQAD